MNQQHANLSKSKRIEYIDAMRGFTMLLVVVSHIFVHSFHTENSFNTFFLTLRMPLFFFISGFVLYKADADWRFHNVTAFIYKKLLVQIIPTVVFLSVAAYIFHWNILASFCSYSKMGYWFTYTLFFYFVIYAVTQWFIGCWGGKKYTDDIILMAIGLFLYAVGRNEILEKIGVPSKISGILSLGEFFYFIFFIIGTRIRKYFNVFQTILDNKHAMAFLIIINFTLFFIRSRYDLPAHFIKGNVTLLLGLVGLINVFAFFRRYQECFTKKTRLGVAMQYIGRRTLDIYLLHYLLLPYGMASLGTLLYENTNDLISFIIAIIFAVLVITVCLLISSFIRLSSFLSCYLFGVKK